MPSRPSIPPASGSRPSAPAAPAGFTLIELLIVVAIIAILAAIAVPNFLEAQIRSRISRVRADLRTDATAIEAYIVDAGAYPPEGYRDGQPGIGLPDDGILSQVDAIYDASISLIRLTTPIQYIGTGAQFADPFLDSVLPDNLETVSDRPIHALFYTDYMNFAPLRFSSPADRQVLYGAWGMSSVGPGHHIDGILYAPWQFGRFGDSAIPTMIDRVYDPSNGTVSAGDISRFGGAVPALVGRYIK
jgi:prepilin-type N-terminal cleavage/methylation domain-containing protein